MIVEFVLAVLPFVVGMAVLAYSSKKAVEHTVSIASNLNISPLLIGLVVVSVGTDIPEIFNSIMSSSIGHGDINVGDSFGSILAQITLIIGLITVIGGAFKVRRDEIVVIGACELLALIAAISMVEDGYISRMNAVFLVASWPLLVIIIRNVLRKDYAVQPSDRKLRRHVIVAVAGYLGVMLGAYIVINAVVTMANLLHVPEYFISFFAVAIGTSLPELAVDLTAVLKKQYEIAIGDAIGSCIVDAGLSIGIGPLIFPTAVSGRLAETTGLYALLVSVFVILTLAVRRKVDRKAGIVFIVLYGLSYGIVYL
jgi:cation:H+ antiporter